MFTVSPSIVICKFTKSLSGECKIKTYHDYLNDVRDKMFKTSYLLKKIYFY